MSSPLSAKLAAAISAYLSSDLDQNDEPREQALETIVSALKAQQVQVLDLVLHLEKSLSDGSNPAGRKLSVRLLVDCIGSSADLKLNFKHVETFVTFFCSKLRDFHCVEWALKGLILLLQRHEPVVRTLKASGCDTPIVGQIAQTVFKEVHTPSHTQPGRKAALDLVHLLLERWRDEVSAIGSDVGEGIAVLIDEERDPRNVLLAFVIAKQVLSEVSETCVPEKHLSRLFESLTSYFPITFKPPKDDKFGITGDDLRDALARALSCTRRLANQVVPFCLEAAQDINAGDSNSIGQALDLLGVCLESYGPEVAKEHIAKIVKTSHDQVCRTDTPCRDKFTDCFEKCLTIAMRGIPKGLHPHWLARSVDPELAAMATEAAKGDDTLECKGARKLLLAAARAHVILLGRVWASLVPKLLVPAAGSTEASSALPSHSTTFLSQLAQQAEGGGAVACGSLLAPAQLRPALAGALAALRATRPVGGEAATSPAGALELVGRLCQQVGEKDSAEAFGALFSLLSPSPGTPARAPAADVWAGDWCAQLAWAPPDDPRAAALVEAIYRVLGSQPTRATDAAPALLSLAAPAVELPPWLVVALPRLLAAASLSLAKLAVSHDSAENEALGTAKELLAKSIAFASSPAFSCISDHALDSVAEALEGRAANDPAARWVAFQLQGVLGLPEELGRLCTGLHQAGGASTGDLPHFVHTARRLAAALLARLSPEDASALRARILEVASGDIKSALNGLALLPVALPAAMEKDWAICSRTLPSLRVCAAESQYEKFEPVALEALDSLVAACPTDKVDDLLKLLRAEFGQFLEAPKKVQVDPAAAKGAVRCWAACVGALLRRGGFAPQAASFLKALLEALESEAPVSPFVPHALQVLMPPAVDGKAVTKLPPLALQQLSLTTLPALFECAKRREMSTGHSISKRAALESAVSLLCALPPEVACTDCKDALRWCTLTCLKYLKDEVAAPNKNNDAGASVYAATDALFAAQGLQLLVRVCNQRAAWVEDDLGSVVPPLTTLSAKHCVPLVRLGSLQALLLLIQFAHGHLLPYGKQIENATRKAIEDRRREVRLVAVACLNAWHCNKYSSD